MGAEGFLVASTINLVVAQRLVRKICTNCIESYKPSEELIKHLSNYIDAKELVQKFYRGKGCVECSNKGYKGRIGIFENLEVNEEIRELIIKRASADEIYKAAVKNGMVSLIHDGLNKASGGVTTIEEVLRVVKE